MSRKTMKLSALCASLTLAAAIAGCGTSNKEGNLSLDNVAKVDEALCAQCHGSAIETLTGDQIYQKYMDSKHNLNYVGCQDCHGGGAQHNGVGPIPYPKPGNAQCATCHDTTVAQFEAASHGPTDFTVEYAEDETHRKCSRCHTHQGAVLSNRSGYTGDSDFLTANAASAPGLDEDGSRSEGMKCITCHVTHKTDELRAVNTISGGAVVPFQPTATVGGAFVDNKQFILCTSCHNYTTPAGELVASGTAPTKKYYHNTAWYRIIATTHWDNPNTPFVVEGYVLRNTSTTSNPCFDCHAHNAKTNTRPGRDATIHTDWAKSGHGGELLTLKTTAAAGQTDRTVAEVDAVMAAGTASEAFTHGGEPWSASCIRCHTSTGAVNFFANPVTPAASDFSHLAPSTPEVVNQAELIYCWACHSDVGAGTVRPLGNITATAFKAYSGHKPTGWNIANIAGEHNTFPNAAASNICISCHDGRYNNPGAITDASTYPVTVHYMPAASTMYVKMGFVNLSTTTSDASTSTYRKSLKSTEDGGTISSTHRKLGTPSINGDSHNTSFFVAGNLDSTGPCVTCHLEGSHTLKMDQKAIDAVCSKCHDSEAGIDITTEAAFLEHFIEPQAEVYYDAIDLAAAVFNRRSATTNITLVKGASGFYYPQQVGTLIDLNDRNLAAATKTAAWNAAVAGTAIYTGKRTKLLGAISNIFMFDHEKASYAHARTYSRRLLYDTIDFLDDGVMNMSVSTTANSVNPAKYTSGAKAYTTSATVGDIASGTSESMLFLRGYNRTTGAWNAAERP